MIYRRGTLVALCIGLISMGSAHLEPQDFPPEFVRVAEALRGRVIPDLTGKPFVRFTADKRTPPQFTIEHEEYGGWLVSEINNDYVVCVHGTLGIGKRLIFSKPSKLARGISIENYHIAPGRFSSSRPDVMALMFFLAGEKSIARSLLMDREDWSAFADSVFAHFLEVIGSESREQYVARNYEVVRKKIERLEVLIELFAKGERSIDLKNSIGLYKRELDRRYDNPGLEYPNIKSILKLPDDLKYQGLIDALTNEDGTQTNSLYSVIKGQGKAVLPYLLRGYAFDIRLSRDWGYSGFGSNILPKTVAFICYNYLVNLMPKDFKAREGFGTPEFRREKALRLLKDFI